MATMTLTEEQITTKYNELSSKFGSLEELESFVNKTSSSAGNCFLGLSGRKIDCMTKCIEIVSQNSDTIKGILQSHKNSTDVTLDIIKLIVSAFLKTAGVGTAPATLIGCAMVLCKKGILQFCN